MTREVTKREFLGTASSPHLLITGGVHGDEFEPIAAIRRIIEMFNRDASLVGALRGRITLVPVVNYAAFLRGHRMAADELDLARICPGQIEGSITERVAAELSALIREADYYIDLHTGGTEYSVLPLSGYALHRNPDVLEVQRRMARAFNLPIVWGTSGELEGRSLSVARDANVPAIYCEYFGSGTCSRAGVDAYVDGCFNVMAELGMLTREPPLCRIEHIVEDQRPQSGHMQINNPSPITGLFEPAVTLGDRVHQGDLLGIVHDLVGDEQQEILADRAGIVLVLRTFPRVQQGQSVGVVLEV